MLTRLIRSASAVVCCLLLASVIQAQPIDNSTVTIIDAFQAFGGYDVEFAIDTGDDAIYSDYASLGGNIDTYIEFDLGRAYTLTEIVFTDRVTSGGPNHVWRGGLFDYVLMYNYILSVDDNFSNGNGVTDDILIEVEPEEPFGPVPDESELELLQTSTLIPGIEARYVRWEIVETRGQNPGASNFEFIAADGGGGGLLGDFNNNGDLDSNDLDLLGEQQRSNTPDLAFDLNSDGAVNTNDRVLWVTSADYKFTWMGDADLNGEFNSNDLVTVLASGTYETDQPSIWATGDFDGDGRTNSSDLVAALAGGGYEVGPRAAVAAVPEPSTFALVLLAGLPAMAGWRRNRACGSG